MKRLMSSMPLPPRLARLAGLLALFAFAACDKAPEPLSARNAPSSAAPAADVPAAAPAVVKLSERISRPAAERVVAIGDLHGDLEATRKVLRLAGAIDGQDKWAGGTLVVVQTGDEIDRGDGDRQILDLFDRLKGEARAAGGEVIALNGNHELMNVAQDFRYVTPDALAAFRDLVPSGMRQDPAFGGDAGKVLGRALAFSPGGPYAVMLAERPLFVKVGDSVFVHGGVLPKHVDYGLDKLNDETRSWLLAKDAKPPSRVMAEDGPVWTRAYSAAPGREECATLAKALAALGAKRMIMGHTVQRDGANAACGEQAWRIDVGMSRVYGGPIQALELKGDATRVLRDGS